MRANIPLTVAIDPKADVAYVCLTDIEPGAAVRQVLVENGDVVLDFDEHGDVSGIELLSARVIALPLLQR